MFPAPGVYDELTTEVAMRVVHCTTPLNVAIALFTATLAPVHVTEAELTSQLDVAFTVAVRHVMSSAPVGALTDTPPVSVMVTVTPATVLSLIELGWSEIVTEVPDVVDSLMSDVVSLIASCWPLAVVRTRSPPESFISNFCLPWVTSVIRSVRSAELAHRSPNDNAGPGLSSFDLSAPFG